MKSSNCVQMIETAFKYRKGELSSGEHRDFQVHLDACSECQTCIERDENLEALVRSVEMDPLTERRLAVAIRAGKIQEGTKHRSSGILVPAAAFGVALLVAFGVVLFLNDQLDNTSIELPRQEVAIEASADSGERFAGPDRIISTGARSREIEVASGTTLWVDRQATVAVEVLKPKIAKFKLNRGRVVARIAEKKPGFRMIVLGRYLEVEAKGTIFSVEVGKNGQETAKVIEGVVEIRDVAKASQQLLHAGETITLGPGSADDGERSNGEINPNAQHGQSIGSMRAPTKEQLFQQANAAINEFDLDQASALLGELTKKHPRSGERRDLMNRLARAYRQHKNYRLSAKFYEQLIRDFPRSDAALLGAVALAQIEQGVLNNPGSALAHFNLYLKGKPKGVLAEAARAGKVRALYDLGQYARAIKAADDYLKLHPHGLSVPKVGKTRASADRRMARSKR